MKKLIIRTLFILFTIYGGLIVVLTLMQQSLIFHPPTTTEEAWEEMVQQLGADYFDLETFDGELNILAGMLLADKRNPNDTSPKPTVIFFGGNAMQAIDIAPLLMQLPQNGINVVLVDYRGYGLSTGKPSIPALTFDAYTIYRAAAAHPLVDENRISVWGVSLGAGVAAQLAQHKDIEKIILMTPLTSIADAASDAFPIFPHAIISLMIEHELNTLAIAPKLLQSVLLIHGSDDHTIPFSHSKKLADVWGGDTNLLKIEGGDHNTLWENEEMWNTAIDFLLQ